MNVGWTDWGYCSRAIERGGVLRGLSAGLGLDFGYWLFAEGWIGGLQVYTHTLLIVAREAKFQLLE